MAEWYEAGADPKLWPKSQEGEDWARLVVLSEGKVFEYENTPVRQPLIAPFMAWGSGADFAMGAMAAGCNAARAVEIASGLCASCGYGVSVQSAMA